VRIALATDWFAPRLGGIETQLTQLAQGLGALGHEVDVLTTTPGAVDGQSYRVRPLEVARLPVLGLALSPRVVSVLREALGRGYDVVHAHVSVVSPVAYAALAAARSLNVPVAATFHSVLRAKRYLLRLADAMTGMGQGAIAWTAVSELVARQARSALRTDVAVLPNGIDLAAWRRQSGGERASDVTTFVSTLRLHRKKRPLELLAAFRAASQAATPIRLILVGVGPQQSAVSRLAARLKSDGVSLELRGRMSPAELRELYARSDAFVSGSRREAFGIAALEAVAAGLPVIAMREAGSSEFLVHERNALLCGDDQELAHAMGRLAADRALRERLSQPTDLARYDWSAVLAQHEAVYRRIMSPRRAAARAVAGRA
jgi:glycosyltransferase involved in cell wall biosynthesis